MPQPQKDLIRFSNSEGGRRGGGSGRDGVSPVGESSNQGLSPCCERSSSKIDLPEDESEPLSVCQMRTNPLRSEEKSLRASPISDGAGGGGGGNSLVGVALAIGGCGKGCGGGGNSGREGDGAPDQVT